MHARCVVRAVFAFCLLHFFFFFNYDYFVLIYIYIFIFVVESVRKVGAGLGYEVDRSTVANKERAILSSIVC